MSYYFLRGPLLRGSTNASIHHSLWVVVVVVVVVVVYKIALPSSSTVTTSITTPLT